MTRDDIIRMAREAGLCTWTVPPDERAAEWADFAALVAAAERREYAIRIKQDIADFLAKPPAPEVRVPLSDDTDRLNWLLWKLPGDALRYVVGELADTSSGAEFRAAIDAAIAAQGGKV